MIKKSFNLSVLENPTGEQLSQVCVCVAWKRNLYRQQVSNISGSLIMLHQSLCNIVSDTTPENVHSSGHSSTLPFPAREVCYALLGGGKAIESLFYYERQPRQDDYNFARQLSLFPQLSADGEIPDTSKTVHQLDTNESIRPASNNGVINIHPHGLARFCHKSFTQCNRQLIPACANVS